MPISRRHDHRRKGVAMSETRFRWVGRPSEEALLGLSGGHTPRTNGPRAARPPFPSPAADAAAAAPTKNQRIRARELAAVAAVGVLVWLGVHITGRELPSQEPGPSAPTV